MQRLKPLIVGVGEHADGKNVEVAFADPRHGAIAEVPHPAMEVGHLADGGRQLAPGGVVEVGLGEELVPVGGVMLDDRSWKKRKYTKLVEIEI